MLRSTLLYLLAFPLLALSAPATNDVPPRLSGTRPGADPSVVNYRDPNDPSYMDDTLFQSEMMTHHNRLRREHGVKELTWDDQLAGVSEEVCATCIYKHSDAAEGDGPYGENIAVGWNSVRDVCYRWGEYERADYGPEYDNPTFNHTLGHFTQMVWNATERVGCARRKCIGALKPENESWFVVCEYYTRGNVLSKEYYQNNVFRPV